MWYLGDCQMTNVAYSSYCTIVNLIDKFNILSLCSFIYVDGEEVPKVPQWCEEAAINPSFLLVIISPTGRANTERNCCIPALRSRMKIIWIYLILGSGCCAVHQHLSALPTKVVEFGRSCSFSWPAGRRQSRILSSVGNNVNFLF